MKKWEARYWIATVLVIFVYTACWFVVAHRTEARLMAVLEAQQAHGVTLTSARHRIAGYPFGLRVVFRDFSLKQQAGISLTSPRLAIGMGLRDIHDLTLNAPFGMFASLPAGQTRPAVKAVSGKLQGKLGLGESGLSSISLTIENMILEGLSPDARAITIEVASLYLDRTEGKPVNAMDPTVHVMLNLDNTTLPEPAIPALGNAIRRVTLDAYLLGTLAGTDQVSLKAWRDAGGTVTVDELSSEWGPLGAGLGGTLALDNDLQPLASFSANITGFDPALDALAERGAVKPNTVSLVKAGLALIAKPEGDDNIPTLNLPVTIQDRALYLSSFKVLKLGDVQLY